MTGKKKKFILIVLAMYWGFTYDEHMLNMQALAFNGEWENAIIFYHLFLYYELERL